MRRTTWVVIGMALVACAARQQPKAEASHANGWSPVEEAEVHGRCLAGSVHQGMEQRSADRMCNCVVPRLAQDFSFEWFNDGEQVTPEEARKIRAVHDTCARELALSVPGARPGGEPLDQGTGVIVIE